ncbi:hypothetical protein [Streptomyces sp. HUAS TT20]|uniref:hypothetical protein n=1 Tax=Streptomyces sp. HUAS TT20 TaxID=3447509 RepID=UPI0021D94FAB|nr:hypothetical protein [Streptomyces sp. HUAS 15-9]UXY28517.1 hypothetical protein N8I87_19400 [Streptomyces sp. HUAS 15-9]
MCSACEDFTRTVVMLGRLALYAHTVDADTDFIAAVGPSLAASLPEPPPGVLPTDYDPGTAPAYPGEAS